jgi:hypothetical protein
MSKEREMIAFPVSVRELTGRSFVRQIGARSDIHGSVRWCLDWEGRRLHHDSILRFGRDTERRGREEDQK